MGLRKSFWAIILLVFVVISIYLVWNIWNSQPAYETIETAVGEKVIVGKTESAAEAYEPKMIMYQKENSFWRVLKSQETVINATLHRQIFRNLKNTGTLTKNELIDEESLPNSLRFKYPVALTFASFQQIATQIDTSTIDEEQSFDEIIISFDKKKNNVSFINSTTRVSAIADLPLSEAKKLSDLFSEDTSTSVLPIVLNHFTFNSSSIPVVLDKKSYVAESLPIEKFQKALLNKKDPALVSSNKNMREYINGSVLLRYDMNNDNLLYINPVQEITPDANAMIQRTHVLSESLSFINNYSGFTGDYRIEDFDENTLKVRYRLRVDNTPVYSDFGGAVITTTAGKESVYQHQRPMFELSTSIPSEDVKVTLDSPIAALEKLRKKLGTLDDVYSLEVGYEMTKGSHETTIVNLEPRWVYTVNGNSQFLD